jgi:hypothetical protein
MVVWLAIDALLVPSLLVIGLWPPLGLIHWIQLVGTTAMGWFGYCFLARCLSLLLFNRTEPLTGALVHEEPANEPRRGARACPTTRPRRECSRQTQFPERGCGGAH